MKECWQNSPGVSSLFRELHRELRGKGVWTCGDAHAALNGKYTMDQIGGQISNMITGRHVIRLSRGVYRFRGIV